jgi:glycosyltransferase involved in cell wall biosynthesis
MDQLLVISSYPSKGSTHFKKTVGIASYTKNTLLGIKQNKNIDITVFAEELENESDYEEDGIKVIRVWKRGRILTIPKLFINSFRRTEKYILIEFEVSMYGSPLITSPLPFYILGLRLFGKNVTLILHQVITNISEFEGHTNIKAKSFKSYALGIMINIFYKLLTLSSNKVIVFEENLKEKLLNSSKVKVIPHGVEQFTQQIPKSDARNKLSINQNAFVILIFGYIAWYKGTDWLVDEINKLKTNNEFKNTLLIIGGGPNPNHKDKKFYMDYVDEVIKKSKESIALYTGFVEEKDIPYVYESADMVILPYRNFMSASGPLSLAYSFEKPAFVSNKLSKMFETNDISKLMNELKLSASDLTFDLTEGSLEKLITRAKSKTFLVKAEELSRQLNKQRSYKKIGKEYYNEIFNK